MSLRLAGLRSPLAGPFDLTIENGQCVAITGASGSGKSLLPISRSLVRTSVRRARRPTINQMSAAGMDPLEAAKYQILLMFLLSGGSGLAAVAVVYWVAARLTDDRQRLRLDRLATKGPEK